MVLLSDCKIIHEKPTGTVLSNVTVNALPEQTKTLPLYVAAFSELIVKLAVTADIAALNPAIVAELELADKAPATVTASKVFVPANV